MKYIRDVSGNDLSELSSLMYEIASKLSTYSHVYELLPTAMIREIKKTTKAIEKEIDRRESDD